MPYYRILIWTKRRKAPYVGIRLIGDTNINAVFNGAESKAKQAYRHEYLDCEVQMLSTLCAAVKEHIKKGK